MRRRDVLMGLTASGIGAGMTGLPSHASEPVQAQATSFPHSTAWQLSRPKPALANSYFWTWDHSANWVLDDPGILNFGCHNAYLKQPNTYLEDYRRLTDLAAGLGVKGIVVWGFLRDSHGGVESAKRVADYAASRGVAIMPGIGTNWYGGVYYEGNHRYNLETFTRHNPSACLIDANGKPDGHGACPSHPLFIEWLQEGTRWLFDEFAIGGANLENGDFVICHCSACKERQGKALVGEPAFWLHQERGYQPALKAIQGELNTKLIAWASYKGFIPGTNPTGGQDAFMECLRPSLVDRLPQAAVCQWTLTSMLRQSPLPLSAYLDHGAPEEAVSGDVWTAGVRPPSKRSVGFLHQGSQWGGGLAAGGPSASRYKQIVSTIKEACLRASREGLEGISIHGEVSSMHVPWALNYVAFSHFIHWPEDSLREFGKKTLGAVLGSPDDGEAFAVLLAAWESHSLMPTQKTDIATRTDSLARNVSHGKDLHRYRFWRWLHAVSHDQTDPYTASIF